MINFILIIIVIIAGIYFRTKYDKEYALPTIEENADLSFIKKVSIALILFAGLFAFINTKLTFLILLTTIPFVLYLNIKTSWLVFTKNNKK